MFGVNAQTIRRAIKNGALAYIVVQGRYKVDFESVLHWSQRSVGVRNKVAARGIGKFVQAWRLHETVPLEQHELPTSRTIQQKQIKKRSAGRRSALSEHPTLPL